MDADRTDPDRQPGDASRREHVPPFPNGLLPRIIAVICLAMFFFLSVHSPALAEVTVLGPGNDDVALLPRTDILVDVDNRFAPWDVSTPDVAALFKPNRRTVNEFGFLRHNVWLRFTVRNEARDQREAIFILGKVRPETFSVFYQDVDGSVVPVSFPGNEVKWRMVALKLPLPPHGETRTYFLLLKRDSGPKVLTLRLCDDDGFHRRIIPEMLVVGLYLGFLTLLWLATLALFAGRRSFTYFAFSFFVLAFTGLQAADLGAPQMLLPPAHWQETMFWFSLLAMQLFSFSFLELRRFSLLSKATQALMAYCGACALLMVWRSASDINLIGSLFAPQIAVATVIILIMGAAFRMRQGWRPARIYLWSWLPLFIGVIMHFSYMSGVAPNIGIFEYGVEVGGMLQVIIGFLALGDMIKTEREEAQAQILRIEKENALRLEQEVLERTKELNESHERLEGHNRELALRTDLLNQEKKRAENAMEAAKQATLAKSDFLANMSHEIRTPMNAIIGLSHLTLQTQLSTRQKDYLDKIDRASNTLLRIIDDILDFSKIEAGKLDLINEPFHVRDSLEGLVSVFGFKCAEKGLSYCLEVSESIPQNLSGDALRFEQVLLNLASNAVKFTHEGEIVISVDLEEETDEGVILRCSVRDTGIGMSAKQVENLFQSFHQADASITRVYGGTGLGLAISKRLVEMMGGEISVTSEPGKGSAFSFSACFGKTAAVAPVGVRVFPKKQVAELLSGRYVLVVEDNEVNQQVARELLEQVGVIVEVARNGQEALDLAEKREFDVILMDVQMPVMDGLAATRELRRRRSPDELPILAMTANAMAEDRDRCRAAGMNSHIPKPIKPRALYDALIRQLRPDAAPGPGKSALVADALSPDDDLEAFPGLVGVDVKLGLGNVDHDQSLYLQVITRAVKDYRNVAAMVRDALARSDFEEAKRVAHTFKSVAGIIGAEKLRELALQLEIILIKNETESLEALSEDFFFEAERVMASLEALPQLRKDGGPETERGNASPSESETRQLRRNLDELAESIDEGSADALNILEKLKPSLGALDMGDEMRDLEACLEGYEFEGARKALNRIAQALAHEG